MRSILMAAVVLAAAVGAYGQDRPESPAAVFHFDKAFYIDANGPRAELPDGLADKIQAARDSFRSRYAAYAQWSDADGPALVVTAINNDSSNVVRLELESQRQSASRTLIADWRNVSPKMLANALFLLVADKAVPLVPAANDPPFLADVMDLRELAPRDMAAFANPYSVSCRSNGNIVVGENGLISEMDGSGRLVAHYGRSLLAQNNYSFAYDVQVTPSGSIYSRPAIGQDIFIFDNPADQPRKANQPIDQVQSFAVLADGSFVVKDYQASNVVLVDKNQRSKLSLTIGPPNGTMLLAAGPDSTVWTYDGMNQALRIFTKAGGLIDEVQPLLPLDGSFACRQLVPYPDGSFLLMGMDSLRRFDRRGFPIWVATKAEHPEYADLVYTTNACFDPKSGSILFPKITQKQIVRLIDKDWCRQRKIDYSAYGALAAANMRIFANEGLPAAYRTKAAWYLQRGAREIALANFGMAAGLDPDDRQSADQVADIKLKLLLDGAEASKNQVMATLRDIGPETARAAYQSTMKLFEEILAMDPGNPKARSMRASLTQAMRDAERNVDAPSLPPLEMRLVRFDPLFPALMARYQTREVAAVAVTNPLDQPAEKVSCSVQIGRFMDYPWEIKLDSPLKPGETRELALRAPLNQQVFGVEEDLPVQALLTLSWTAGGQSFTETKNASTVLYRRTALTWANSGMLSAFITPNEETVNLFAMRSLENADAAVPGGLRGFSPKLSHAMAIVDSLAAYRIAYLEDPQSPISQVFGKPQAIDTVRFPRTTLFFRNGDCDDSSALLASLLEAAGVKTAIMTTPGHVFIAMDSEEPADNAWIFEKAGRVLVKDGSIWIPIETTDLRDFRDAWRRAGELVANNPGAVEILPLAGQRADFPAISLPAAAYDIAMPAKTAVAQTLDADGAGLVETCYRQAAAGMQASLPKQGRARTTMLNQVGILASRFGDAAKAEELFKGVLAEDPKGLAAYINLSNLYLLGGRNEAALAMLAKAAAIRPDSPMVNLLLAQTWLALGNADKTRQYYAAAKAKSPDLADRYPYLSLAKQAGGGERAGDPAKNFRGLWTTED